MTCGNGGFGKHLAQLRRAGSTGQGILQRLQQGQGLGAFSCFEQSSGFTQGGGKTESTVCALGGLAVGLGGGIVIAVIQSTLSQSHIRREARG